MNLDEKSLYKIFKTRDARYDGRFFVGVKTTGIYCRPVCPTMPKEKNCVYFESQAAAEKAGFRPCLLCRPELAPGYAPIDFRKNTAYRAKRMFEEKISSEKPIEEVCEVIGCTNRHLRRVFHEEFGVTPIEYLQTCRLLLAKELLTDTGISMTDVAYASGFRSIRRFNTLFKEKYHLTPSSFRKKAAGKVPGEIIVKVGYRKPFLYEPLLKFIADRTIEGMEKVEKGVYTRTISIRKGNKKYSGLLHISNNEKKSCLNLTISEGLLPVLPELMAKVKNQFDLYASPEEIYEGLSPINTVVPGAFPKGTRIPGSMDDFEICVRAVIGQLVSVKGARTTLKKFVETFGEKLPEDNMYLFPTCDQFAGHAADITEMLGPLGITKMKAYAIEGAARYLMENPGPFRDSPDVERKIRDLMAIKGIGPWTAEYISMRTMQNTNILLDRDYGIKKMMDAFPALKDKKLQESWNPWKTYITVGLWNLETGG